MWVNCVENISTSTSVAYTAYANVHYRVNKLGFAVPLVEVFQWCRGSIAAWKATGLGLIPGWG